MKKRALILMIVSVLTVFILTGIFVFKSDAASFNPKQASCHTENGEEQAQSALGAFAFITGIISLSAFSKRILRK